MKRIVRVITASDGKPTPHDGRWVVSWNPDTKAGVLELVSTDDKSKARRFDGIEPFLEWNTVSSVEPKRPWDGKPNKPLTAITIVVDGENQ